MESFLNSYNDKKKHKKYILQDNACEAWAMAIKYCDDILAGKISLLYRKYFVESLHNAVELFMKQIMLNQNDYRVAKIKNNGKDGEPFRSYLAASDLNSYFEHLDRENLKLFYSIEFNEIIVLHRKILDEYFSTNTSQSITEQLKLLQRLRNDETHFYIMRNGFLSENEFLHLYNFMTVFYNVIQNYNLLPYWGKPCDEHKRLSFIRTKLTSCSYIDLIMNSSYVKRLFSIIDGQSYWGNPTDSAYRVADCLINTVDEIKEFDFEDLWIYIEMLSDYGKLVIDGDYIEYQDENGQIHAEPDFYIRFIN